MRVKPDKQRSAPILEAAHEFLSDANLACFTTPGHKRNPKVADDFLQHDIPLSTGVDTRGLERDVLGQAEYLAAQLWEANYCRFLVNGSTHGNQAFALGIARPGARVLVSRNLHKSLFMGIVIADLDPIWIQPRIDPETGFSLGVSERDIADALTAHPQTEALLLVEPSYLGVVSDVRAAADLAHRSQIPLVVDQAWGGHFGFHEKLPPHALEAGADGAVISAHKMLLGFTQSALLLAQEGLLDLNRLDSAVEALNTTSPSGAILASLDRARQMLALFGRDLLDGVINAVEEARQKLATLSGVRVLDRSLERQPTVSEYDVTRLVLHLARTGITGFELEADLWRQGIRVEMADRDTLVPLITLGDCADGLGRLVTAVERSVRREREPASSHRTGNGYEAGFWSVDPEVAMRPREAFFSPREMVSAEAAVGRVSAETIVPYPPGIPVIAPGEVISKHLVDWLREVRAMGTRIAYCADPSLETLPVVSAKGGR